MGYNRLEFCLDGILKRHGLNGEKQGSPQPPKDIFSICFLLLNG